MNRLTVLLLVLQVSCGQCETPTASGHDTEFVEDLGMDGDGDHRDGSRRTDVNVPHDAKADAPRDYGFDLNVNCETIEQELWDWGKTNATCESASDCVHPRGAFGPLPFNCACHPGVNRSADPDELRVLSYRYAMCIPPWALCCPQESSEPDCVNGWCR